MKRIATLLLFTIISMLSFGQLNMNELGHFPYAKQLSDIWGYADGDGNEYALVGVFDGFSIVDVTDPGSPEEVYFETGVPSIWRDIKTWDNHAYVSTEGGGGILIVDLNPLPGQVTSFTYFKGEDYPFESAHNIYIDEFGKLYIFGANYSSGGAIICDLTGDPMNPEELGIFDEFYLHDGMARGDTLWGGAIYAGQILAIDVSDPSAPELMGSATTPSQFTHNAWVSDDGTHVFTTDEVGGGFIGSFDVTDLDNITEVDRIQSSPLSLVIPHNAHVLNDYIVTSYYADGVTIHDADRPHNLIEVGNFDTAPEFEGNGYNGCWGVYPFLPSGNIVASDMQEGLYILEAEYVRACYLEGEITDSVTGLPIMNAVIRIQPTDAIAFSDLDGSYAFGIPEAGTYNIEVIHEDYPSQVIEDVELENGELTLLNVELSNWVTSINSPSDTESLNIYPNPSSSVFTLEVPDDKSAYQEVKVFNLTGALVAELELNSRPSRKVTFGQELPSGTYILKMTSRSGEMISSLITKR
jgi:choice-of-anchor B domain-containing protein